MNIEKVVDALNTLEEELDELSKGDLIEALWQLDAIDDGDKEFLLRGY